MKITIGSKNPTKIAAVEDIFSNASVTSLDAQSNVYAQPFSDEETRQGAINRAKACVKENPHTVGIGLEGGVMYIDEELYLCNGVHLLITKEISIPQVVQEFYYL